MSCVSPLGIESWHGQSTACPTKCSLRGGSWLSFVLVFVVWFWFLPFAHLNIWCLLAHVVSFKFQLPKINLSRCLGKCFASLPPPGELPAGRPIAMHKNLICNAFKHNFFFFFIEFIEICACVLGLRLRLRLMPRFAHYDSPLSVPVN